MTKKGEGATFRLSSGYLDWRTLPFPVPWTQAFEIPGPVWVEIGFGSGEFLEHLVRETPDALVIGFEVSETSISRALRRLQHIPEAHFALLHMDARAGLQHLFDTSSIDTIWVNFPDPWPKKRHERRRSRVVRAFSPGG